MSRNVYLIALMRFVLALSFSISWPFVPLYLSDRGLSPFEVGLFLSSSSVLGNLVRPFVGAFSDRFGRVKLMRAVLFFRAAVLFLIFITLLKSAPLYLLFILLFLTVLGFSSFIPLADSYVADESSREGRLMSFGIIRLVINGGFALGSLIASFMIRYGYSILFLAASIAVLSVAAASLFLKEKKISGDGKMRISFPDKRFVLFSLASMSVFLLSSQLMNNFSIYANKSLAIPKHLIAYLFSLNGFIIFLLQIPAMPLTKRIGYVLSVLFGVLGWAIAFTLTFFASSYLYLVVAVIFMTLSEIAVVPVLMASASNMAPSGRMGTYVGFWSTFQGLGYTLGPAWGGFLLEIFHRGAWLAMAFQALLTGAALSVLGKR